MFFSFSINFVPWQQDAIHLHMILARALGSAVYKESYPKQNLVLLVKRNTLRYSYFHRTFMFLLLVSVSRLANYQNLESQILGLKQKQQIVLQEADK